MTNLTWQISAFTAADDLSQLAVGFANGSVTVVRGDLVHDRGAKQRTVHESEEPITGLEFREESRITTLYIATTSRILKLVISGRGQGQAARVLEDSGCAVGCMTLDKKNGDIVVVRDDAIYYYGVDGRGPCYAYDGPKSLVTIFENYVALVSPPVAPVASTRSNILRRFGGAQADNLFNTSTFTLLETGLKFVAHSESLVSQVKTIFMIWDDFFTLTQDGKVSKLYARKSHPLIFFLADISLSRKVVTTEARDIVSTKSVCACHQLGTESWNGCTTAKRHISKVRRLLISERGL